MSIRTRLILGMTLSSGILIVLGSLFFLHQLSGALTSSIDTSLRSEAASVLRSLPSAPPKPQARAGRVLGYSSLFNSSNPDHEDILASRRPGTIDYVAQIVDPSGQVASSDDTGPQSLASPATIAAARRHAPLLTTGSTPAPAQSGSTRLLLVPVKGWPGWLLVLGASLRQRDAAVAGVQQGLVLGGLIAIVLIAAGAGILARVALGPVERLRRQAATLAEMDPEASLEEPHTHDEIARLASTLNLLLAKVRSSLARQRRLVADASHELRTPLAILHGELQLADRPGRTHAELVAAVHNAARETRRLVHLGEDLLFLSRSDESSLAISPVGTDIGALLQHVAQAHRQAGESRGVTLAVEMEATIVADIDESHIRRALDNLIYNALRFSPPGTTVRLKARVENAGRRSTPSADERRSPAHGLRRQRWRRHQEGAHGLRRRPPWADGDLSDHALAAENAAAPALVIEVTDEGPGFPPDLLPHAFERFRRSVDSRSRQDGSRSADGGSGLGLAIVQAIAQAHGGYCTAANSRRSGASVRMILPMGPAKS